MKKNILFLLFIFLVAFLIRLYKIDSPIADWHSWRQADTSAVTRNFVTLGFNPFIPRYDDLSNIQTGQDNPLGYRFVEFPIYNIISYFLILVTPGLFTIEIWQRLVSIFASLFSIYFIYKLMSHYFSEQAGLWAGFFFAVLPFSIYYSRVVLPEPIMVAFSLAALYTFVIWAERKGSIGWLILSGILVALAILTKPFAVFFFPPLLYVAVTQLKWTRKNIILLSAFGLLALVPFGLWRFFIQQYPEGIPSFAWLFNKDNIRGKGAFFNWLFAERLGKLILGYFGSFFLLLGIVLDSKKGTMFLHVLGLSMLSYLFIIAGGNVQHDYYQFMLLPIVVMYMGRAIDFLTVHSKKGLFKPYVVEGVVAVSVLFMLAFSWFHVRSFYWINNPIIVQAGRKADELLPKNAKVIAPYGGDTAFLYQTGRQGWPIGFEIEEKVKKGATHYVSVNPTDAEVTYVKEKYQPLFEGDGFIIITLQ